MDKKIMRTEMLRLRKTLPDQYVTETGMRIGSYVSSLNAFADAETIMLYCDFQKEMATGPLMAFAWKKKKRVVLPLTDSDFALHPYYVDCQEDLTPSPLGILEPDPGKCQPCPPEAIDMILVPGVAFDVSGNRLGFGKGCYDHFLPLLRRDVPVIALAYDFQVLPHIPGEAHDFPMDAILTEKGLLNVSKARNLVK